MNKTHALENRDEIEINQEEKVPFRVLERRIQSFSQTTVPHDVSRLRQHKQNIITYHKNSNWAKLNMEQVNASRTVQQLKTHVHSIDELRQQLNPIDHGKFLTLTEVARNDVQSAIEEYGMVQSKILSDMVSCDDEVQEFDELTTVSDQSALIPKEEAAVQSWEELRKELLELNELTQALHSQVKEQRKMVTTLEAKVEDSAVHVQHGEMQLRNGQRMKSYVFPVGGAIVGGFVGGIVAGPIGALIGFKVAALSAAAAGAAGAIGGAFVGYKANDHNKQHDNKKDK